LSSCGKGGKLRLANIYGWINIYIYISLFSGHIRSIKYTGYHFLYHELLIIEKYCQPFDTVVRWWDVVINAMNIRKVQLQYLGGVARLQTNIKMISSFLHTTSHHPYFSSLLVLFIFICCSVYVRS